MMQYWIAILERSLHSGSEYSTGIQYRIHVNTPIETLYGRNFSSVRIQDQDTAITVIVSGYSTGCM